MNFHTELIKSAEILKNGGIILYPGDTIWGIGCDALNEGAVKRIFSIKGRDKAKAMLILLDTMEKLSLYVRNIPEIAWQLIEASVKPVTIIYPGAYNLAPSLISEDGSIGIRISKDKFCRELIKEINAPLVSTSANLSGQAAPGSYREISDEIKNSVDYIVKLRLDEESTGSPSSLIKLFMDGSFKILRT